MPGVVNRPSMWTARAAALVAVAALTVVAVLPAAAVAATATAKNDTMKVSAKDCELIGSIGEDVDADLDEDSFGDEAAEMSKAMKSVAKRVRDKKLRQAMQTVAAYYDKVGDVDSITDATKAFAGMSEKAAKKYAKAFGTFAEASLACVTQSLNDAGFTVPSTRR